MSLQVSDILSVGRKLGYAGQMRSSSNLRQRTVSENLQLPAESSSGGGLSVTGCMADFSLYVFHPYGGGQKKTSPVALEKFESRRTPGKGKLICRYGRIRKN